MKSDYYLKAIFPESVKLDTHTHTLLKQMKTSKQTNKGRDGGGEGGKVIHSFIALIEKYIMQYGDSMLKVLPVKMASSTEQMVDQEVS